MRAILLLIYIKVPFINIANTLYSDKKIETPLIGYITILINLVIAYSRVNRG